MTGPEPRPIVRSEWLREEIHGARLKNGLVVYVLPKAGYLKKYAVLATRYGSIDNEFALPGDASPVRMPAGIAHFLEHELFEQEGGNAFDRFSKNGAYSNAFTSYTTTAYLFSCTDLFRENLDLLIEFVGRPYFTDEAIRKEREIISQEIRMYDDSPDWRSFMNLLEGLFVRHPVRIDITGTVDSIRLITKDLLERCYATFYRPDNMVLFVAGDLHPAEVFALAEAAFAERRWGRANGGGNAAVTRVQPDEPAEIVRNEIRANLDVSQPRIVMGFKDTDVGYGGAPLLKKDIEVTFALDLIFGRSSEFYQRRYETGLIDQSFSASFTAERDHGYTAIGGETDDPEALAQAVLAEIDRAKREGFADEDFRRIKHKGMGKFLRNFNSLEFVSNSFIQSYFLDVDFFDYLPSLDAIRPEDIRARIASHFQPELCVRSIVEPLR